MRCPFCRHPESRVVDSRISSDGAAIRRRRECLECKRRFTTREQAEKATPAMVVKKDARREPYDRAKIVSGLEKAFEKRPFGTDTIDEIADRIESAISERGEREISTEFIGGLVMSELHNVDQVAYVRFASVYRSFKDIDEFMRELQDLIRTRKDATQTHPRAKEK